MATLTKDRIIGKKKARVEKKVEEGSNDPFFIKKREAASKLLKKTGLPASFTRKK